MAVVTIARNAVVAQLRDPPKEVKAFVTNLLSYQVEGGLGFSGTSSFFSVTRNSFPAGFAYLVKSELEKIGHTVYEVARPHATPLGPENPIVDEFGNDDPRYDYQMKALRQVEKHGAGIIRVATGGGKSKIAKLIAARFRRMTLFLTTRGILLYQMDDQLKEIGLNTGQIGDGELRFVRGVNLGMVQTLIQALEEPDINAEIRAIVKSQHLSKNKDANMSRDDILKLAQAKFDRKTKRREAIKKFLELVEVVIGEEAHEAGGTAYYEILRHCKNATIRVALTATPFMKDSAADNMRLMAAFGPILIDIPESLLIERGILAKPYFKFIDCEAPKGLHKSSPFERAYTLGYVKDTSPMHAAMLRDARMAQLYGLPVLTLVARTEAGDNLLALYKRHGLKGVFLRGDDDQKVRKAKLADLAAGVIDFIIGTKILDVGVDCPAIGLVQLGGGMKAEVELRQRIGRGLRYKKKGPNITFIADYSINLNGTLRDHARKRENIVRQTPGFVEGILAANQNFPWEVFERKAAA
jgi:superfamily II DNA or RNA helicase